MEFQCRNVYFQCEMSNINFQRRISNVQFPLWDFQREISNVEFPMWNFQCGISNVEFLMFNFQCRISNVQFPMWNFQFASWWWLSLDARSANDVSTTYKSVKREKNKRNQCWIFFIMHDDYLFQGTSGTLTRRTTSGGRAPTSRPPRRTVLGESPV